MPYKFYECHSHIALDGVSAANAERRYRDGTDIDHAKEMFAAYKNAGIEFLRDGGDKWDTGARAKGYAEEYGITFLTPVFPIFKKGNYGGFLGRAYESISDYRALVPVSYTHLAAETTAPASGPDRKRRKRDIPRSSGWTALSASTSRKWAP